MKSPDIQLVKELLNRQKNLKMNNTRFARLLGISRPLWVMTRSGQRVVNTMLLSSVAKAFPDMDDQILDFLRSRRPDG